jgi:hypothetical protein
MLPTRIHHGGSQETLILSWLVQAQTTDLKEVALVQVRIDRLTGPRNPFGVDSKWAPSGETRRLIG